MPRIWENPLDCFSDEEPSGDPPKLDPIEDADKKKIITKDIDNHLYNFPRAHGAGMEAMAYLLSRVLIVPIQAIKTSMGRVYSEARTFDFKELVENMDIVIQKIVNDAMKGHKDRNKGALYVSKNMIQIVLAAKKVYQEAMKRYLKPYKGVPEMMEAIRASQRKIIGLTDAPKEKTITRLGALGLTKYFGGLYAQPSPRLDSPNHVSVHCEGVLRSIGYYNTDFPVIEMHDQRKPNIDLASLYEMSQQEVTDTVVMCGDNPKSDMQLAVNNNCVGIYSAYGQLTEEEKASLRSFGQKESTENRNLDSGDEAVKKLQEDTRNRIYTVTHPIQILDLLGIERPDHFKPED